MGRRSWWYEVSKNEYEETKRSYGSNIYALDPRLIKDTGDKNPTSSPTVATQETQDQQAFSQGKVFIKPFAKSQKLSGCERGNTVDNKHKKKTEPKRNFHSSRVTGSNSKYQSEVKKSQQEPFPLAQRQFIYEKILALGSADAVKEFYSRDDAVSKYAKSIAHIVLSAERVNPKSEGTKADLMNSVPDEVAYTIKQRITKLKAIVESPEELTIKRTCFGETLEELRNIFRNCRDSFSSSDIENIQYLKEQFENVLTHHI